jgi:predicted DNA-binding transcriptional regulator YafY
MPADSTRNTLLRQWELLKLLPSRGAGKSAGELAQALNAGGFTVSKRQVERDLNTLGESFPLECNDKSIPYGWRWADGASADMPGMTLAEALSLRIVEDTLRPLLPTSVLKTVEPHFLRATQTLSALKDSNRTANWANKVRTVSPSLPLLPPHIPSETLECIQDALLADDQIEIEYLAMGKGQAKTLTLNPLGLVQRGPVSYLVATVFTYTDIRLFAIHRIADAKRLYKGLDSRPDFNMDEYIHSGALQFGGGEIIHMEARLKGWLTRILEETPLSEDQTLEHDDEGGRVIATVLNTPQLHWWILSQGAGIEVLAPVELRTIIAAKLAEALCVYTP